MWTAARIPKATSQIKEFPAAAFYFPLSERLNTDAGRLSRLANAHLPTCHARLHFHLITRRRLFSSHSDDFLRVQTLSIFHFLRALHTRRNCMCAGASGLSLCVHAESGRPNVSLREYFTEIMATGINIALFVLITEMEQRKVAAAAGLDVGYALALLLNIEPATCLVTYPHSRYCCCWRASKRTRSLISQPIWFCLPLPESALLITGELAFIQQRKSLQSQFSLQCWSFWSSVWIFTFLNSSTEWVPSKSQLQNVQK
jgi:hypothetical protein